MVGCGGEFVCVDVGVGCGWGFSVDVCVVGGRFSCRFSGSVYVGVVCDRCFSVCV